MDGGAKMNIISMSLYGDDPLYKQGFYENLKYAKEVYPGWEVWVFTDQTIDDSFSYEGPDIIRVRPMLPQEGSTGMFWRFLAAGCEEAEHIIFRDTDSRLNVREKAAVDAWIESGKALHVMRDHPDHQGWPMLGGMWGIKGGKLLDIKQRIQSWPRYHIKLDDMFFLANNIWPDFKDDCIQHGYGGEPFPPHPQYEGFVGEIIEPT